MSTKILLTLSASVLLGAAVAAPNAALAQFGPPPGPPPGLGAGGPPPGLGAGGPPLGGPPAGPVAGLPPRGPAAAAYSANSYTRNSCASYGYDHGYRYWPYAAAAGYAYGSSHASSDDGCYDVSAYRQYGSRRVLVCDGN